MLTGKFTFQFTALTLLFLATYLAGKHRNLWPHVKISVGATRILQVLLAAAFASMIALFVMKLLGFTDPFRLWSGVLFTLDLALWWYVCRVLRKDVLSSE